MTNSRRVHFVGIGGTGMAPLATILLQSGIKVSGSDCKDSPALSKFRQAGVRVSLGHSASNLDSPDLVVVSLAVNGTNGGWSMSAWEYRSLRRPAPWFAVQREEDRAADAWKEPTASMMAYVLERPKHEPSAVAGKIVLGFGGKLEQGSTRRGG